MYLTVKQQVKHLSKEDYSNLKELSHTAKNLTNEAIYNVRQYYFTEGEYLNYEKNYSLLKSSPNYKKLNSNMAQQILKEVDGSFQSFFGLLKLAKKGKYAFKDCKLPHYLPKDGFTTLVIGFVRLNGNKIILPYSQTFKKSHKRIGITIPPILADRKIKEIRIIPKANARFFEIQYIYEVKEQSLGLDTSNALSLDLGINNLVTAVSNNGKSFIIDGKKLKSINQWYNKQEESYTSKASFWDKDNIPVYNNDNPKTYTFSGKRVHRGMYQSANGKTLNADVNGALNIMRKSNVVGLTVLYTRGEVDTPVRIRIA